MTGQAKNDIETLSIRGDYHQHLTRNRENLDIPYTRLKKCQLSYHTLRLHLFNTLPINARYQTLPKFKIRVQTLLFANPLYSVQEFKVLPVNEAKNTPRKYLGTSSCLQDSKEINPPSNEPPIPAYQEKIDEPVKLKRARLLYQSRKRGMLENGLVLSTFAARYLNTMEGEILNQYDRLINLPTNDWDIYYWATGVKPTPLEFSNEVMDMLKEHVKNKDRESRIRQPDLTFDNV